MKDIDYSCKFPWTWLNVKLDTNQWRFCCKPKQQSDFSDSYDSEQGFLAKTKKEFLLGLRPSACEPCWKDEDQNGISFRTHVGGAVEKSQLSNFKGLEIIDVIFGNTCNVRCITCRPLLSSNWYSFVIDKDVKNYKWLNTDFLKPTESKSIPKLLEIIEKNKDTIININIYGGEPSIDPNFISLIEKLRDLPVKTKLTIISNGVWPNDNIGNKFENYLSSMRDVGWDINLKISLDSIGESAEFIRHPTKWKLFESNFQKMVENNFCKSVNITTSLYNINNHYEIPNYLLSNTWSSNVIPIINLATEPPMLSVANLGNYILNFKESYDKIPDHKIWFKYKKWLESIFFFQKNGTPNINKLLDFIIFTEWYSTENKISIPDNIQQIIEFIKIKSVV